MHILSSSGDNAADSDGDEWGSGGSDSKGKIDDSFDDYDNEGGDDEAAEQELGEATVRLVRLFANICINEDIGVQLAKRKDTINVSTVSWHRECIVLITADSMSIIRCYWSCLHVAKWVRIKTSFNLMWLQPAPTSLSTHAGYN
jgi:hypothetical protein